MDKKKGWKNDPNNRLIDIQLNISRRSKRGGVTQTKKKGGVKNHSDKRLIDIEFNQQNHPNYFDVKKRGRRVGNSEKVIPTKQNCAVYFPPMGEYKPC